MSRRARSDRAFNVYYGLGASRSLARALEVIASDPPWYGFERAPSLRSLEGWSARDGWVRRAADLDREARERERQALVEQAAAMRERQRTEGLFFQQLGIRALTARNAEEVRAADAMRLVLEGFRLEERGIGDPDPERSVEERLAAPLEGLSDDELHRLVERLRRDTAGGPDRAGATSP
jgi:hypothetical protein